MLEPAGGYLNKLPKYQQAVVDSEYLWFGGHHTRRAHLL